MHPLQGHVTDVPDTVGHGDDERIDLTGIEIDVARIKNNKNISSLSNFQNRTSVKTYNRNFSGVHIRVFI